MSSMSSLLDFPKSLLLRKSLGASSSSYHFLFHSIRSSISVLFFISSVLSF